ncbi:hypothetical protein FQN60_016388, partial [Etheostoma spectabile]
AENITEAVEVAVSALLICICKGDTDLLSIHVKASLILSQLDELSPWCKGLLQEPKIGLRRMSLKFLSCRYTDTKAFGLNWSDMGQDVHKACDDQTLTVMYNDYGEPKELFKENSNDPPEADKAHDVKWFNVAFEWRETLRAFGRERREERTAVEEASHHHRLQNKLWCPVKQSVARNVNIRSWRGVRGRLREKRERGKAEWEAEKENKDACKQGEKESGRSSHIETESSVNKPTIHHSSLPHSAQSLCWSRGGSQDADSQGGLVDFLRTELLFYSGRLNCKPSDTSLAPPPYKRALWESPPSDAHPVRAKVLKWQEVLRATLPTATKGEDKRRITEAVMKKG